MNQSQVSIWVPIVVGTIGLVGVIAGQLVNAWREDRRWKREQEREESRWQQQTDSDDRKHAHESALDWRDRRIALYSDYLQSLRNYEDHYRRGWFPSLEKLDAHVKQDYDVWQQVEHSARRVEFVASDDGLELINRFHKRVRPLQLLARSHNPDCKCIESRGELSRKKLDECQSYTREFVNLARRELRV